MAVRPIGPFYKSQNNLGQLFLVTSLYSSQIFKDCPIKHMVVFEALAYEKIVEDPTQIGVFRCVAKARRMDVVKISHKFPRKAPAQNLCTDRLLLLHDQLILLRLIRGLETLPWERAPEEVEKHIS